MDEIKISSTKSFGLLFSVIFLLISLYPLTYDGELRYWSLILSIFFLYTGLFIPRIITPLNILWFKLGIFLGKIVSPVIMTIIFFGVVTPIGLLMNLIKKDLINLKFKDCSSYWIEKKEPKSKMKNQF